MGSLTNCEPCLKGEVRRRNQNIELFAPDDDALERSEVGSLRDAIVLAAFEGAKAAEVDAHLINEVAICPNAGFRNEIDVIFRPGPDFEVVFKEKRALEDFNGALAVMDRIARIGVGKGACRDRRRILFDGELLQRFQRWENIRKQEKPTATPNPVPNTPPIKSIKIPRHIR